MQWPAKEVYHPKYEGRLRGSLKYVAPTLRRPSSEQWLPEPCSSKTAGSHRKLQKQSISRSGLQHIRTDAPSRALQPQRQLASTEASENQNSSHIQATERAQQPQRQLASTEASENQNSCRTQAINKNPKQMWELQNAATAHAHSGSET